MNTKWKVISSIMLLIMAICSTFALYFQHHFDKRTAEFIAGKKENAALLAEIILANVSNNYRKRITSFTAPSFSPGRESMIRAFATRERELLFTLCTPLVKALQKENTYFSTVGWILPDNRVFLRMHNPDKNGDNISVQRPDIAAVNRDKKQLAGFDIGSKSMQYRIAQPVFYENKYIGAAQFGIQANIVFDALHDRLQTIAGMAVANEELKFVKGSHDDWVKGRTHTIITRDSSAFRTMSKPIDWNADQQRVQLHGRPYIFLKILALNNYQQEKMGFFFVALDLSEQVAQKRTMYLSVLLISSILLVVSFFILYFSYGSLIQRIVNLNNSLEKRVDERTLRLQESEQKLQQILDQAPVGILIADAETRRFQYANPAICMMLGYSKKMLESLKMDNLHEEALMKDIIHAFGEKGEGESWSASNISFLCKDKTCFEADVISTTLWLDNRLCMLGFVVDQTETNKIAAQLHRAQKMEAIGLMAGGVAHDLNNMLSGVISYPELLLLQLPEDSNLRKPIIAIQESGLRAAAVVADLLTVARGAASVMEPQNINQLIQEYLDSPECEKLCSLYPEIIVAKHLSAEDAVISCSPLHIKKTVMNLLTNAAEAISVTGKVTITTENQNVDATNSELSDIEPGYYVVLSVQDNGQGISPQDLEHIFEPFYTRKKMGRSGTGLGLSVVWNTIQDHKGKISVKSSESGTCFKLYFPVSREPEISPENRQKQTPPTGNGELVLVVDDEPNLRDIASKMLRAQGYSVDSVSSGEQALEFLAKKQAALLVIDMQMEPGMNGRETYEKILGLYPGQRAIIASGYSESDEVTVALSMGAGGFIRKPYTLEELARTVRKALLAATS